MNLREATKDKHEQAEETALSKLLVSGLIREATYAAMLENMMQIYAELESDGLIRKTEVLRYARLRADLDKVGGPRWPIADTVRDYTTYIRGLDATGRWAHIYVHYLGHMYGGQMIGRALRYPHTHLEFDDLKNCMLYVRENLSDVDPAEANKAFDWTIRIYDELHQLFG